MLLISKQVNFRCFLSFVLVFGLIFGLSGVLSPRAAQAAPDKSKAPDFSLKGVDGKTYSLSAYRGKAVLLNFWATWCPACVEELPGLQALAKRFKGNLQIISVSIDASESPIKDFLSKEPLPYPVLEDPDRKVAFDLYAVFALPVTFLIDKNGDLAGKYYGAQDWTSAKMIGKIKELMR